MVFTNHFCIFVKISENPIMAIDENVKNKVSISRYLGTYNDILKENSMSVLASYGNNKSHVLSKAKRLAKKASKNTVIQWQVFVNDTLKPNEQTVVKMKTGAGYDKEYQFSEIGEALGITSERARQMYNSAIKKLRSVYVAAENN